ncbi:MAG: hypothetical protein FWD57_00355 [Polyangiaceae bacterium]|nr:hypothetical protein [Polyangiaceae bacterium]
MIRVTVVAVVAVFVLLANVTGCTSADATPGVRVRAAQDFVCAESTIDVQRSIDGSYVALGCGKRGVYHAVCEGVSCSVSQAGERPGSPRLRNRSVDPGMMGR